MESKTIDDLTIGEIRELQSKLPKKITIGEALPILKAFRDKYGLNDKDTIKVSQMAIN